MRRPILIVLALVIAVAAVLVAKHMRSGHEIAGVLPGSELEAALKSGLPTMADFGAGWCEQCKKMEPVLHESAARYEGRANVVFVNTDDYRALAGQYRISVIPTQVFFDADGHEANRHVGYWPLEEIDKQFAALGVGG